MRPRCASPSANLRRSRTSSRSLAINPDSHTLQPIGMPRQSGTASKRNRVLWHWVSGTQNASIHTGLACVPQHITEYLKTLIDQRRMFCPPCSPVQGSSSGRDPVFAQRGSGSQMQNENLKSCGTSRHGTFRSMPFFVSMPFCVFATAIAKDMGTLM
jgi:hypothetical protein